MIHGGVRVAAAQGARAGRSRFCTSAIVLFGALVVAAVPLAAAQVRVPDGTLVALKLHYNLTTENVLKGDRVDFDVAENVVVDGHVVIPRGAVAWGKVIKVKGAGKKNAKDAFVTFAFSGVRSVDSQTIDLRLLPYKSKKHDSSDEEVVEASPIPGLRERMIGAPQGKEYAAYTDGEILVNVPERAPAPSAPAAPAAGEAAGANPAAPAKPEATKAAAPAVSPALLLAPEPAAVDFRSNPSAADIVIDGNFVGSTPSTLRLAPGEHKIEIRMTGYSSWERQMKVASGSHPSIEARLQKVK